MSLSDDDPRPPYEQIASAFRRRIESGELSPRQRLPSTRELMEQFGVANQTVQRAMRILSGEGLVQSVAGRGTYVSGDAGSSTEQPASPSPEYARIMARLDSIVEGMTLIDERLAALEAERPKKQARKAAEPKTPSSRPSR